MIKLGILINSYTIIIEDAVTTDKINLLRHWKIS